MQVEGRKLSIKFVLPMVVILLIIQIAGAFFISKTQSTKTRRELQTRGQGLANMLAEISGSFIVNDDLTTLKAIVMRLTQREGVQWAVFYDAEGKALTPTEGMVEDASTMVFTEQVSVDDTEVGAFTLGVSTVPMQRALAQLRLLLAVSTLGVIVMMVVTLIWLFERRVTKPLRTMTAAVGKIAEGNITSEARTNITSHDEVGVLAHGFNLMTDHLSGLVRQVQQSGIQVTTSATQLAASGKQLESMMTEQVASTNEVVVTAKEIAATSQGLVRTMQEVTAVSEDTAMAAESGQSGLAGMESTMHHMEDSTRAITDKLGMINERAANITSVVTTIAKVADQTNLLSLNAAIEAERAGEYGQGFAVVAREIRRLADQTALATLDIEHMVKEMTSAISAGVVGMDQFAQEVRQGVEDVRTVGGQLAQIITQVQDLTPRFDTVNAGMQSQAQGAQQISEAMQQLSDAAQQTASTLRESTRAIEQLSDAAQGLHQGISRFTVEA